MAENSNFAIGSIAIALDCKFLSSHLKIGLKCNGISLRKVILAYFGLIVGFLQITSSCCEVCG